MTQGQSLTPILLLAAGRSARMRGRDKLLEDLDGTVILAERARMARDCGGPVLVALPPQDQAPGRWNALDALEVIRVPVMADPPGLGASIAAGIAALPDEATGVLLLLADMPGLTTEDLRTVLALAGQDTILRGASGGRAGHPVYFPRRDFAALSHLTQDRGAQEVIRAQQHRVRLVDLPDDHATLDLDTPEDWARYRARKTG